MVSLSPEQQHGVVISPDIVTNGETGQEEEEVGAEPASQLAGEQCHGSRERMLGKINSDV